MNKISFKEFKALGIKNSVEATISKRDLAVASLRKLDSYSADWIAVPVIEQIDTPEITRLSELCTKNNIKQIYALSPLWVEKSNEVFAGEPKVENFYEIKGAYVLGYGEYIIFSDPECFQLITDSDYYTVFLGSPEFLSFVLGYNLDEAMQRIEKYKNAYAKNKIVSSVLLKVINACKEFNAGK